jgi:hypothetical protein
VDAATALPFYQPLEEWFRGNEFGTRAEGGGVGGTTRLYACNVIRYTWRQIHGDTYTRAALAFEDSVASLCTETLAVLILRAVYQPCLVEGGGVRGEGLGLRVEGSMEDSDLHVLVCLKRVKHVLVCFKCVVSFHSCVCVRARIGRDDVVH